jgi:hypothetical protein
MLSGVKVECWNEKDEHASLELSLDEEEGEGYHVLDIELPPLKGKREISLFVEDLERAIRQLKTE